MKQFLKSILPANFILLEIYRGIRDYLSVRSKPIKTPWGFLLCGNVQMAKGNFEPEETEIVRKILNDVDVLVNVGSNIGYYCCHALSLNKMVYAFEPLHRNIQLLYKNILINGWKDIEVYPFGLSEKSAILNIYGNDTGASIVKGWANIPENYLSVISVNKYDELMKNRLDDKKVLVIVDIEGAELFFLKGAMELIKNKVKPIWLIEISIDEHQPEGTKINPNLLNTFKLMYENGYVAYTADKNYSEVKIEDIEQIESTGVSNLSTHNFIFR